MYSCLLDLNHGLKNDACEFKMTGNPYSDFMGFVNVIHSLRSSTGQNQKALNAVRNAWRKDYAIKYIPNNSGSNFCTIESFLDTFRSENVVEDVSVSMEITSTFKCSLCQEDTLVQSKEFDLSVVRLKGDLQTSLDH